MKLHDYEDCENEDGDDDNNAGSRRASYGLRSLEISPGNGDARSPFDDDEATSRVVAPARRRGEERREEKSI